MLPAPCMGFISDSFHGSHRKTTEHFTMHMHWVLFAPLCTELCVGYWQQCLELIYYNERTRQCYCTCV